MALENVQLIIGRAVTDSEFRNALFADPDVALAGYELTDQETAMLKAIDAETLESFAGTLDDRISKSLVIGFTPEDAAPGVAKKAAIPQHLPEGF